jgi:hypothetical protein
LFPSQQPQGLVCHILEFLTTFLPTQLKKTWPLEGHFEGFLFLLIWKFINIEKVDYMIHLFIEGSIRNTLNSFSFVKSYILVIHFSMNQFSLGKNQMIL